MAFRAKLSIKQRIGVKLIGAAIAVSGLLVLVHTIISPNIIKICEYNTKSVVIGSVSDAVSGTLAAMGKTPGYEDLVFLTYDESGRVTSVQSNVAAINTLKSRMLSEINRSIFEDGFRNVELSLGTLSGISAFYTLGASVTLSVEPKGFAAAEFISEFSGAGINQTLHRMVMRVKISVTAFIPFYTVQNEITADFPIAETVIVGVIPESYTHVVTAEEDLVGDINDFGAQPIKDR